MVTTAYELNELNTVRIANRMQSYPFVYEAGVWAGMGVVTAGTILNGIWKVEKYLIVELKQEGNKAIAILNDIDEYGIGDNIQDAISDLLSSLVDYRLSLEKRADKLATKEKLTLELLKETITHIPSS
jgi:hypothetical protein